MEPIGVVLNKCKVICENYEKRIPGASGNELFYQFCDDTIRMAFMIAVSDGYVDSKEIDVISKTFGVDFDYSILSKSYGLDYLSDESYMKKIPISIKTVAELEKSENPSPNCFLENTRVLYGAMKEFGNIILNCTGATLKFCVMIQSYFINNILNFIFRMEELDGFSSSQLDEAVNFTKSRLAQRKPLEVKYVDAPEEKKAMSNGGLKMKVQPRQDEGIDVTTHPLEEFKESDNSAKEFNDKNVVETQLESYRGDLKLASFSSPHRTTSTAKAEESNPIDMDTIHEILNDVDGLVGLGNVKKEIHDMVNMMLINEMRRRKGLKSPVVSRHLVFTGNPGTGKTTIARAIGKIYKTLGILEKGHMIETDRTGMVAGYMGQTAEKVSEVVKQAMGGILFIDEAYSLVSENEGDFGQEAINTLLKLMEDNRDNLIVIVAGYTEEMKDFINSNPGLRSRFNRYIQFNDYSDDELLQIFKEYVSGQDFVLEEGTDEVILDAIQKIRAEEEENFGNARSVRNYFEKVISNQANRLMELGTAGLDNTDDLMTITKADLIK